MKILVVFFLALNLNFFAQAQATHVVNEALFELNSEVWTRYDFNQFVKAKNKVQLNPELLKLAGDDMELFIMTRLLLFQMTDAMSSAELVKYNVIAKIKDIDESLAVEIHRLNTIRESDDSRYRQLVSKDKYEIWMNYMKKKYSFVAQ